MMDSGSSLFSGSLTDYTIDQNNLLFWCRFYNHYVYSKFEEERPPESAIKYDLLMDRWVERQRAKEKQDRMKANRGKNQHTINYEN